MQPCRNFATAVEAVATDVPVCLYMGSMPAETAKRARRALGRKTLIPLGPAPFVPLPAVLWPRKVAQSFYYWGKGNSKLTRADDNNAAKWMRRTKQEFLVAVPSLVQHDETEPSVKGSTNSGSWCRALFLSEDGSEFLSPKSSD